MSKINISIPDGLLEEIDRRADQHGLSRSGFLREAAGRYISTLDEEAQVKAREKRLGRALEKMRSIAPALGAPDTARVIRELRDAQPRWEKR